MFDKLTNPAFLTLTVPNVSRITKRTFSTFRGAWNQLRKQHSWILGGVFAIETTYNTNRPEAPWHVHAHVLIDAAALPVCKCRPTDSFGNYRGHKRGCEFISLKMRLEFDWLCLTGGKSSDERWRPNDFNFWLHATKRSDWKSDAARHEWNSRNRRLVDIRKARDRKAAAREVLKYVTKASDFCNIPNAVDEFIDAVKGARMLQTFGSWYGFKFPDDACDWSHLECDCGQKKFERTGKLFREAVFMNPETGRWHIDPQILSRGSPPTEERENGKGSAENTGS